MTSRSEAKVDRNHRGYRIGEKHQRAKLSDEQVRAMRELREKRGKTYGQLMMHFRCPLSTVRDICTYMTRTST